MPATWNMSHSTTTIGFLLANGACLPDLFEGIMAASVNIATTIAGVILNAVVCVTIVKTQSLQTNFGVLVCNLSVADLLLSSVAKPLFVTLIVTATGANCASSPDIILQGTLVFSFAFNAASMAALFVLSVDRCLCVVFPIKYPRLVTRTRIKRLLGLGWFGILSCILIAFVSPAVNSEGARITILIGLTICYVVVVICYTMIYVKIRKQNAVRAEMQSSSAASQARERKLAITMALVVSVFTLSWAPLGCVLLRARTQIFNVSTLIWVISVGLTNSAVNPVLYFFRNPEYRLASVRVLCNCCGYFHARKVDSTELTHRAKDEFTR